MIITLLHFIYLTLPFCAGIDLKTLNKEEKKYKEAERLSHSPPTRKGELAEAEASICTPSTC